MTDLKIITLVEDKHKTEQMKRIVFFIGLLFMWIVAIGQTTGTTQADNIIIKNVAPYLHLNGVGAQINFYNGDLKLTRSDNVLTLSGGIFKISTDTAATQSWVRANTSTSSLSIEGADSANVDAEGNVWFFHDGDTLIVGIPSDGYETGYGYFVALLPDTTHVTDPTYTVVVGDQEVYFTDSFVLVTLPTNATAAIPIGSTINFFSYAGLIKFAAEAGAVLKSAQDSVTTSQAYQVVSAKKVATNKWWIYGSLGD